MRREDLFCAISMIEDKLLAECEIHRDYSSVNYVEDQEMKVRRKGISKKFLLIAAIIALMLALMGSAIAALVAMKMKKVEMYYFGTQPSEEFHISQTEPTELETVIPDKIYEGESISFDEVQDVFVELGSYYPHKIPDGYAITLVSNDAPLQNQTIHYKNDAGLLIQYWIYVGDPASKIEIYDIKSKTDVSINGQPGVLYEQNGGGRLVAWMNKKAGYGFALRADDPAVDLLAMAVSTAEGEPLNPTLSDETRKALEELGDFNPQYLPEGFEELNVQGYPIIDSGWYSYVRKWYVNKEENTHIYFEYETYSIVIKDGYTDDAKTACSFFIPGCNIRKGVMVGEEIMINGMFGIATEKNIAWADTEKHVVYHLYSDDVTGEMLLKIAHSIIQNS